MLRLIGSFSGFEKETGKQVFEERFHSSALTTKDDALTFLHCGITNPRVSSVLSVSVLKKNEAGTCTDEPPIACNRKQAIKLLHSLAGKNEWVQVCLKLVLDNEPCTLSVHFAANSEEFSYSVAHAGNINSAAFMQEAEQAARQKNAEQKSTQQKNKLLCFVAWLFK